MEVKKSLLILFLFVSSGAFAVEDFSGPPPEGLLHLAHDKVWEGSPRKGAHELEEYCYRVDDIFVVYSRNFLGEGFSFLDREPGFECSRSENKVNTETARGLKLGVSRKTASEMVGVGLREGNNRVVWHHQRTINGRNFDDVTTLDMVIEESRVKAIYVFNTVTN